MTATAIAGVSIEETARSERFYVRMAATSLAVAVVGFVPTYWAPMFRGTLGVAPIAHVHAVLFYGWMSLFLSQTWLVASGRIARHREFGVAGVALAGAMVVVGLGMAISSINHAEAAGAGDVARACSVVSVTGILLFAVLVALAVANVRKPEVHKRLMLVASVSLLQAGVGRWFAYFLAPPALASGFAPPPPVAFTVMPGVLTDLLIVVAMIHDRKTRGRVHPAYWAAGASVLVFQLVRVPLSTTRAWDQVARWLATFTP